MKYLILVIVLAGGLYFISTKINKEPEVNTKIEVTKSEIEKIMEEENFKKATVLRARKVANDKKKDVEIQRNKEVMANIEKEYENIRQEELTLVGGNDTSLK